MDYIFRYPLNKAHYYQRQAESQEIIGHFQTALKLRESALENLNAALNLVTNDVINENIKLQITYEKKQIERLHKLGKSDVQRHRRRTHLKFPSTMDDCQLTIEDFSKHLDQLLNLNSNDTKQNASQNNFKSYLLEIVKNTEIINRLASGIEIKQKQYLLNTKTTDSPSNPDPVSSTSDSTTKTSKDDQKSTSVPEDGQIKQNSDLPEDIFKCMAVMVNQLKEYNSKNLLTTTKLMKEVTALQVENNTLRNEIENEKRSSAQTTGGKTDELECAESAGGSSPFLLYPLGQNYVSSPLSVEEFTPLDCPPLDFLKEKQTDSS